MYEFDLFLDEINLTFAPDFYTVTTSSGGGTSQIASKSQLGSVIVGDRLTITTSGVLSAVEQISEKTIEQIETDLKNVKTLAENKDIDGGGVIN